MFRGINASSSAVSPIEEQRMNIEILDVSQ